MSENGAVMSLIDLERDRHVEELGQLLRIRSISALSEHREDVRACAQWLRDHMFSIGLQKAEVRDTSGHPIVYGEWAHPEPGRPTVLVYGHYDV